MIERRISRAVITGPTGAIGTALCLELAKHGVRVFAVCRPDSHRMGAIPNHENISVVPCDAAQMQHLTELIPDGADAFFHLAWAHTIGAGRDNMNAQIQNIQYTIDAVRVAAALGCNVFLGVGSQAEYGRTEGVLTPQTPCFPENGYGMAKLCAGQMSRVEAQKLGIDHVWVRILSVYGPGDGPATMVSSVIQQLLAGEEPALTEGAQQWDYLYSTDAAKALCLAAKHGVSGKVYPLGSGKALPLKQYIQQLRDAINPALPLGFGRIPYGPLQVMHLQADISELSRDTGFAPCTEFADGIRQTIEWIKRN